jgi:ssDNA thymidine ADP-ribosyltransferase, DarT
LNLGPVDISNQDVQYGRAGIMVPCTGKALHDYVPLYWVTKTPMSSAVRMHNDKLIYLRFSADILQELACVLSDGNARTQGTYFWEFKHLSDLDGLDIKAINTDKYAHDDEVKRRKQSEVLVLDFLPLTHLHHVVCPSIVVKQQVEQMLMQKNLQVGVYVGGTNHYYR